MKLKIFTLFFVISLFSNYLKGQCTDVFVKNINRENIHSLATKAEFLVLKSNFDYSIQFENTDDYGIIAIITTTGHNSTLIKPMEKNDKFIFISSTGEKLSFDFILDGAQTTIQGRSAYVNTIQMNLEAVKWLASNTISIVRYMNMVELRAHPYSLEHIRQTNLKKIASCFVSEIDPTKIKGNKTTTNSNVNPSNSKNNSNNATNPNLANVLKPNASNQKTNTRIPKKCQYAVTEDSSGSIIANTSLLPALIGDDEKKRIKSSIRQLILTYKTSSDNSETAYGKITIETDGEKMAATRLKKGNKAMFISSKDEKRMLDFSSQMTKEIRQDGILEELFSNSFKLGTEDLKWLTENEIVEFRFVDVIDKKMYPYSVNTEAKARLKNTSYCFLSVLETMDNPLTNPSSAKNINIEDFTIVEGNPNSHENIQSKDNLPINNFQLDPFTTHGKNANSLIWSINDMQLNSEVAAKKYLQILNEKLTTLPDQKSKELEVNIGIGTAFFEQKQYENAIPFFQKALDIIEKQRLNADKKSHIESFLASILVNKELYEDAAEHNQEALLDFRTGWADSLELELTFHAYLNQGVIFQNLDSALSDNWYVQGTKQELKDWKEELKKRSITPIVFADDKEKTKNFNLALLSFKNAQSLVNQFDTKEQIHKEIEVQLALGALYFEAKVLEEAKKSYTKVLNLANQHYDKNHPVIAEATRMLSEIDLAQKSYKNALSQANQILENLVIDESLVKNIDKLVSPFEIVNAITTKGVINYESKENNSEADLKKILAEYNIASKLLLEIRKTHRNEGNDYQLESATDKLSQHAVVVCEKLHTITKKNEYLDQAFDYAELSKSGVEYEITQDLKSAAGIPKEDIEKENGLKSQLAYLKNQIFYELQQGNSKDEKRIKQLQEAIDIVTKEHQKLLSYFEKKYPQYYALKYKHKTVKVGDLQKVLTTNEVFLEYVATDSFIYVLAISQKDIKSQFTKLSLPLSKMVKILHYALKKNKAEHYEYYGNMFYKTVIGDLSSFIKNKKLIIAPDAELHYIPFAVLPTSRNKTQGTGAKIYSETHYLIEDHPICYNHSASVFVASKNLQHHRSNHQIATWAPHFDSMSEILKAKGIGESLSPLPGAEKEAKMIAKLFDNEANIAEYATEYRFKQSANPYCILHIATHGILNDKVPLSSSLVLSNEGAEDGLLTAEELYNMTLNADLAVLSACNSGMGKLSKAEGMVGVASGFAYAGVPNIVMSKWPVSDYSTEILMEEFYKNLKKGMPKDEALQLAQIKYLNDNRGNEKLLAPFFWGGFVLRGNNEPIEALVGGWSFWWYLGIVVVVFGVGFLVFRRKKN